MHFISTVFGLRIMAFILITFELMAETLLAILDGVMPCQIYVNKCRDFLKGMKIFILSLTVAVNTEHQLLAVLAHLRSKNHMLSFHRPCIFCFTRGSYMCPFFKSISGPTHKILLKLQNLDTVDLSLNHSFQN